MTRLSRNLLTLGVALLAARFVPPWWCAREAPALWGDDAELHHKIAAGLAENLGVEGGVFSTGNPQFDGEWWFGTFQMTAIALDQMAALHPADRDRYVALADIAIERMLSREVRQFDARSWSEDPLDGIEGENGHAAWLGYTALALTIHLQVAPESRWSATEQLLIQHLARRFDGEPLLLQTYPGERYPVDNAAGLSAIALHDRLTGDDHSALLLDWTRRYRERFIGPSGLLLQSISADGRVVDGERGSGTLLAAWFFSFSLPDLSRQLWTASYQLRGDTLGFGMMREYPPGVDGSGDIDSGPVILGYGISPTGFAMGVARAWGDEGTFHDLFATATLFGGPVDTSGARHYVSGGPLGDALLAAMFTTRRAP
jgi:hypothetical protein